MAVELIRRGLPKPWSFAVTRDGRIFFINDEMRTTTWLHPVTGEPVCTGNTVLPNLPAGWERSVSPEGVDYYIDHNRKETTFIHPVTQLSAVQFKPNSIPIHHPCFNRSSDYAQNSLCNPNRELRKSQKKKGQQIRSPIIKRNSHSPVSMEGWLYKLEGGALKQWRKRWFVLADFCLFYYKGPDEEKVLGSILLPSYKISVCSSDDKISRKFAFKAEHHNMKTYYFASDTKESMAQWMNVMSLASIVQNTLSPEITTRSLSPKVTFSNDDEDSGFTSYKSRRYGSTQDPNSTLNSSFASEQLHFQHSSNEFGKDNFSDSSHITGKLSENDFLGSGDKYPGHYGSDISRSYSTSPDSYLKGRQPLYANAPPKPKRTSQKDPYAIAPNEQYNTGIENIDSSSKKDFIKSPQYRHGVSCPRLSNEQNKYVDRDNQYISSEYNKIPFDYLPHNKMVCNDNSSTNPYKSPIHNKDVPPARPHSADFLEHDTYSDPFNTPIVYRSKSSSKKKSSQPQRPKSSLECYDPYRYNNEDIEKRENIEYWQKENLPHSLRNFQENNNSFEDQNVSYYSLQNMSIDQQYYKDDVYEQYQNTLESSPNKSQKILSNSEILVDKRQSGNPRSRENRPASTGYQIGSSLQSSVCIEDKKFQLREESMKRLLEWKQRMLQSPLSRKYPQRLQKTQDQVNDLEAPPRPPLPEEYHKHVLQELESHEAQLQIQEKLYKENNTKQDITVSNAEIYSDKRHQKSISEKDNTTNEEQIRKNARSPSRSQEHRRSSSSLGRLNNNYSSDDEGSSPQKLPLSYSVNDKLDSVVENNVGVFRTCKEDPNMSDSEIHVRTPSRLKKLVHQSEGLSSRGKRLSISAGDLLGKTHEELVLLLIQLRRNQYRIAKAKQQCHIQLENEQYLAEIEPTREEHFKKCEELRCQMLEFQKQFEMGQPLINLVENMVKLGSLYGPERNYTSNSHLEENTIVNTLKPCMQLLTLSRQLHNKQFTCKDGSPNININEENFEERLQQLYHSDRILQDEFNTFTSLQQDRDILEITLEGIKKKVSEFRNSAMDIGRLYKQQRMIEKELSRVTRFLMQNIQKLECILRENMKIEQDIITLKQQIKQFLQYKMNSENSSTDEIDIESELKRIQQIIDDLSSHRRNINNNVEKVKAELKHKFLVSEVRVSPTGVAGSIPLPIRKKHQTSYMETDLDTMETRNLAGHCQNIETDINDIPLYANAEEINSPTKEKNGLEDTHSSSQHLSNQEYNPQDISEADDRMKMFYGIIPKDKPNEIKTVRIVKRESERRNRGRDKKKVTYDDNSLVWVVEEPEIFLYEEDEVEEEVERLKQTLLLPNLYGRPTSLFSSQQEMTMSAHERLFGNYSTNQNFQENKIIDGKSTSNDDLSPTKRNKRRHYTISGFSYNPLYKGSLRSCDDVDMERCLRTANTPDIVRSTIKKSDVFDDKIIDRELGLPQKINIPERYIDDDPEQLSATERLKRSLKAETIRRMLSETTTYEDIGDKQGEQGEMLKKKVDEEKKRRAHLLALNHTLAREVMEKSKIVAANISSAESPYSLP